MCIIFSMVHVVIEFAVDPLTVVHPCLQNIHQGYHKCQIKHAKVVKYE
jgi:hypothetical protein